MTGDANSKMNKIINAHPAVISVWASVIAAGHLLPTLPILGTGGSFSLSTVLYPLSGIFFGPLAGALCSAVGGFIGSIIAPHTAWMGLGTFIVGTTTAFTTGCIAWKKLRYKAGAVLVYITGTILWFTQEIGRSIFLFPLIFYGLGFTAMIAAFIFAGRMFAHKSRTLKFPAIWLCTFAGLIGGASIGNFFSLLLYKQPREVWAALAAAAPVERAVFAAGAMLVGAPLLFGLNKIGIYAGPAVKEEEEKNED